MGAATLMFNWLRAKLTSEQVMDVGDSSDLTRPNLKQLSESLTLPSPTRKDELWMAAIDDAMRLATYIPNQYVDGVKEAVISSTTTGRGLADLVPYIASIMEITPHNAHLIALDLTRKVFGNSNKQRMEKLGLKKWRWLHTGGGNNPFSEHVAMSGKIYRFDDPPVINSKTGQRGFPSDLLGCKCRMQAVISFDDEDD